MNELLKIYARYKPKLITASAVVLFIIGFVNLYFVLEITPRPNDECIWVEKKENDKNFLVVNNVKFDGVAWQAGIRDGDILHSVNDMEINFAYDANVILTNSDKEYTAYYTLSRNGYYYDTEVGIKWLINYDGLALSLISLIWLIVGFIVVMAKPQGLVQTVFYRIGALLILFSTFNILDSFNGGNPVMNNIPLYVTIDVLQMCAAAALPFILIYFFSIFPKRIPWLDKKWFKSSLVVLPIIMFLYFIFSKAPGLYNFFEAPRKFVYIAQFELYKYWAVLIFAFILGIVLLFINYSKLESSQERNSIFVILVAYILGIAALVYTGLLAPAITDTIYNSPLHYTPIILLALIPIAFGYSVFRYSLMDVSDVLKNTIFYGTATITIAGFYFLVIYVLGQTISQAIGTEYQGAIAALIFISFGIVFQSTKDKFQEFITAKFYPEQFTYQKVLLGFINDIPVIVGFGNILDYTLNTFTSYLKLNQFGIMLLSDENDRFELVRSKGICNSKLSLNRDSQKFKDFYAFKKSSGLNSAAEREDFEFLLGKEAQKFYDEGIFTIVPMKIKGETIGILLFGLKYSGSQFAGKDLELLSAAANQTAIAIENARLYESEAERKKIEADLDNARKIQQSLLPGRIPKLPGIDICGLMVPAMHVGGDYFDVIKVSDTKVFIVTGDVSGKGLAASFYMSKLQTIIQLYCNDKVSPSQILKEANKRIYNSIEKNWFITASLALVDTEKGTISYCRAGHSPLLICNNEEVRNLQPKGIGLGLERGDIFDKSLEEINITIKPNDVFVFYSDGLTEAMNPDEELYGQEKLEESVKLYSGDTCNAILKNIYRDADKFRQNEPHNDDVTIVVVKAD